MNYNFKFDIQKTFNRRYTKLYNTISVHLKELFLHTQLK